MDLSYKLYTLDGKFITKSFSIPNNFTGIIEYYNGDKEWHINGKCHRLDGPAVEYSTGCSYYINNKQVSEEQHKLYIDLLKLKGLL